MNQHEQQKAAYRLAITNHQTRLTFNAWQKQLDPRTTSALRPTLNLKPKATIMSNSSTMLLSLVNQCDRASLIGLLSDETAVPTDVLRTLVFVGLGGDPATPGNGAAKPAATPAAAKPAKPGKPAKPAVATAGAVSASADIDPFVDAFIANGVGFAVSDLVAASGTTKGRCSTALKNAMATGKLHRAGDRRFSRYGGTLAIATAASTAARAS